MTDGLPMLEKTSRLGNAARKRRVSGRPDAASVSWRTVADRGARRGRTVRLSAPAEKCRR